jgi:arylsulfatase A-like enzyme
MHARMSKTPAKKKRVHEGLPAVLSIGAVIGFFAGFAISFEEHRSSLTAIVSNRYLQQGMLRISALALQPFLWKWLLLTISITAGIALARYLWERYGAQAVDIRIKNREQVRVLVVATLCSLLFLFRTRIIAHYFSFLLPEGWDRMGFVGHGWLLIFTICLGWLLTKVRWERMAPALIVPLVILNAGIVVDHQLHVPAGPNIIWISIDSLRADHLGCYGYKRNTSPHIDELAGDAAVFTDVFTKETRTPPCLSSFFTALHVRTHGVRRWNSLPPRFITLAEVLRDDNYVTGAYVDLPVLSDNGLGQGFRFQEEFIISGAKNINRQVMEWLETIPRRKKFFLFVHYMDVHRPYLPDPPFDTEFDTGYTGRIDGDAETIMGISDGYIELSEKDVSHLDALYDGGIKQFDADIAVLFDYLKERGLYDDALIIITADHGEMLGYHPKHYFKYSHDAALYNSVIRIPLIIKFPSSRHAGKRYQGLVESIDIMPTLLRYAGLDEALKEPVHGRSLFDVLESGDWSTPFREFTVSETYAGNEERISIFKNGYKYIYNVDSKERELYRLKDDPLELHNIIDAHRVLADRLHDMLNEYLDEFPEAPESDTTTLSEEARKRLKSLGYLQ